MTILKKELNIREFLKQMAVISPATCKYMKMSMPATVVTLPIEDINKWTAHAIAQRKAYEFSKDYIVKLYTPNTDILKTQIHLPKIKNGVVDQSEFTDYVYNKAQREGKKITKEMINNLLERSDWKNLQSEKGLFPIILSKVDEMLHAL